MSIPLPIVQQYSVGTPVYDIVIARGTTWELPLGLVDCLKRPLELDEDTTWTGAIYDADGVLITPFTIEGQDNANAFARISLDAGTTVTLPAAVPSKRSRKSSIGTYEVLIQSDDDSVLLLKGDVYVIDVLIAGVSP